MLTKYKYLIIIFFIALILRLYHIDFPISGWHAWRQADTAAMARNFATENMNILYPAIDWRGTTSGYVECEFQLYTFIIALFYKMFGVAEVWGRILSVVCSLFTVWGVYAITKKVIDERTGLWAAFFYAVLPLNAFYGRAFMPEQMMLMSSVLGVFYYLLWIEDNRSLHYLLSVVCISIAVLLKIPALYIGLPLFYASWIKYKWKLFKQPLILIFALVVFTVTFLWYYHSHLLMDQTGLTFGIWEVGTDKWGNINIILSLKYYNDLIFKSLAERHFTYPAFLIFITGLFLTRKSVEEKIFDYWLIALVVYFMIVAKGNQVHEYYQLPFMLPAVVYLAKPLSRIQDVATKIHLSEKWVKFILFFLVFGTVVLGVLRLTRFYSEERYDSPIYSLSNAVATTISRNDLVVSVADGNPAELYNIDRKGWICSASDLTPSYMDSFKSLGAKYLVGQKDLVKQDGMQQSLDTLLNHYNVSMNTESYFIIKL